MIVLLRDITIINELLLVYGKNGIENFVLKFGTIYSALSKEQKRLAKKMEKLHLLKLVELPETEDETLWMIENLTHDVSIEDMYFLRYVELTDCLMISEDSHLIAKAKSLGISVNDSHYLKELVEDFMPFPIKSSPIHYRSASFIY